MPQIINQAKIDMFLILAEKVIKSGLYARKFRSVEAAFVTMCDGYELGISPMCACRELQVTSDGTKMPAKLQLSRARKAGIEHRWLELTSTSCTIELSAPNRAPFKYTFTWQDASRAGLTGKDNWKKYPVSMLAARCESNAIDLYCPEVTGVGIYDPDELGDETVPDRDLDDADVDLRFDGQAGAPKSVLQLVPVPQAAADASPESPVPPTEEPELPPPPPAPDEVIVPQEPIEAIAPPPPNVTDEAVTFFFRGLDERVLELVRAMQKKTAAQVLRSTRAFKFPIGRKEGKLLTEGSLDDLEWYGGVLRNHIQDPKRTKFINHNVMMLLEVSEVYDEKMHAAPAAIEAHLAGAG